MFRKPGKMTMPPEFKKAQDNMQPGVITADGFLGDERINLVRIISRDESAMERLGVRFEDAADRLEHLMNEGRKGLGEPVAIEKTWLVRTDEARGHLPSPFEDGIFRKVNATIVRLDGPKDRHLRVTALSLHLMRTWHFLQGKGAAFRLEPEELKYVLDL